MADDSLYDRFTAKLRQYTDIGAARDWLEANQARVLALFDNLSLRDFVFEPIKGVFVVQGGDAERAIRQTITPRSGRAGPALQHRNAGPPLPRLERPQRLLPGPHPVPATGWRR